MKIIVITGTLASGKSTYAKILSEKLNLLLLTKDQIKEILGDDIGFKNREENLLLSKATMDIIFYVLTRAVKSNTNLILEANFHQEEIDYLKNLQEDILVLNIDADEKILYKRFMNRIENENRHKVHQSAGLTDYHAFVEYLEKARKINFNGLSCIKINANDFSYQEDPNLLMIINDFLK